MVEPATLVQVLSLPVAALAIYFMYKLASNHVNHSIQAVDRLSEAVNSQTGMIRELTGFIKAFLERDK